MFTISHIHPMLVHFPIALLLIGFLCNIITLYTKKIDWLPKASQYLLFLGTIFTLFTWLSGKIFTSEMSGTAGEVMELHEIFATITLLLSILTSILNLFLIKGSKNRILLKVTFIMYALTAISVGITGYFGGTLVYSYMMSI